MKDFFLQLKNISTVLLVVLLAGCTQVPLASDGEEAEAKTFRTVPGKANIYIYRPNKFFAAFATVEVLYQGRIDAYLGNGTFVVYEQGEGTHKFGARVVSGTLEMIEIHTVPGRNYFFETTPKHGWVPGAYFRQVDEEKGRKAVSGYKMVKHLTW